MSTTATVKIAVSDEDPEFGSKFANLIKLQLLLSEATSLLRQKFRERWSKYRKVDWDPDRVANVDEFITGCGGSLFKRFGKIQKDSVRSGNIDSWDITTLADILINVDFKQQPQQGPPDKDNEEKRQLEQLKQVRNLVAHNPKGGITDQELEPLWTKAEPVVLYLGGSAVVIQKIKASTNVADFESQNTSNIITENSKTAESLKEEGNALHRAKKFEEAIEVYTKGLELDGLSQVDRGVLHSNRSAAYICLAEFNEQKDMNPKTKIKLGRTRMSPENARQLGRHDAKETVRLRPAWYKGYFRSGNAYHSLRKYEKALRSFEWALSLAPGQPELTHARDESRRKLGIDTRNEHLDPEQIKVLNHTEEDTRKMMEKKLGVPVSKKAMQKIKQYNEKRIPGQADVYKGHDYRDGTGGMKTNEETAVRCYTKAASAGNAEGIYNLALMYTRGQGVRQDFSMAVKLLKEAASKPAFREHMGAKEPVVGVAEAEHSLGLTYEEGVGVATDYREAYKWYKKAAVDHNYSHSANNMAFMYRDGKGVEPDMKKAGQYWHLAATLKNALAMESLAIHYAGVEQDPIQARHWYEQAILHGNLHAQLQKDEFYSTLATLEEKNKKVEQTVTEWESSQGLQAKGLKLEERVRRAQMGIFPEGTKVLDDLEKLFITSNAKARSPKAEHKNFDPDILSTYAQQGSETAKTLVRALKHFYDAMDLFFSGLSNKTWPIFCHEMGESCRNESLVIQLPAEGRADLSKRVHEYLKTIPVEEMSDRDRDARISYIFLNMFDIEPMLRFSEACKHKYPEEGLFQLMISDLLAFSQDYKKSLRVAKEGVELFPDELMLWYNVAAVAALLPPDTQPPQNTIQAYEEFLRRAPKDHRKVPLAYYAIGNLYRILKMIGTGGKSQRKKRSSTATATQNRDLGLNEMQKYYRLGQEAEKIQLPCFLPYECTQKSMLETFLRMEALIPPSGPGSSTTSIDVNHVNVPAPVPPIPIIEAKSDPEPERPDVTDFTTLTSPLRVKVIREHREHVRDYPKVVAKLPAESGIAGALFTTATPQHRQAAPLQLSGLKPISFKEMDMFVDKVYEDCVLAVRSIEDPPPVRSPSVRLVLEDENRDVCRAFIYNFGTHHGGGSGGGNEGDYLTIIRQRLRHGARLSIINPYMRQAQDGGWGIRLDDPNTLFLHSAAQPKSCRFCGRSGATQRCSKCGRAYYCGRECQELDWKKLQHKLVCNAAANA